MKEKKEEKITVAQRRRMAAEKYAQSLEDSQKPEAEVQDDYSESAVEKKENEAAVGKGKKREPMTKKKKTIIAVSVISVFLVLVIIAGVCINSLSKKEMFGGYDEETHGKVVLDDEMTGVYTCLLVATDKSKSNTDTIMLAVLRYDDVKRVDLISIPRDTRVLNPSGNGGHVKINSIMARNGGKINALVTEVRNITGIPINDFMLVDIEAVKKSVDMFGGVMFDVPMDMHYEDGWQELYIHLDKGMQLIDGDKAEQLLRYRYGYADADLGRTRVQREFMVEAFKQHAKASNLSKISKWYSEMGDYIQTQITYDKAYKFATIITGDEFEINSQILPGTVITGSPDYFYDAEKINQMARELGFNEGTVVSTPHPSVNSNSGSSFGSNEGPASTILEEIPVETVVPTDPGIGNSGEKSADSTEKPSDSGLTPTPSNGAGNGSNEKPSSTPENDEDEDKPTIDSNTPASSSKPVNTNKPDVTAKPNNTEKPSVAATPGTAKPQATPTVQPQVTPPPAAESSGSAVSGESSGSASSGSSEEYPDGI